MPTAVEDMRRVLHAATEQLLIIRWPSHLTRLAAIPALTGRAVVPADVLTYWELTDLPLEGSSSARDLDRITTFVADPTYDFQLLLPVIRASFDGYANHYSANPSIDADAAALGYIEWAQRTLADTSNDVVVLLQEREAVGFATLTHSMAGMAQEILLAGLAPRAQGRGWYRKLVAAVSQLAHERGLDRVIISTQAHNVRVQRAWTTMGFRPFAAFTTAHAMKQ